MAEKKTFRKLGPRNKNNFEFHEVKIKEIYDLIQKSKPTKAQGNCELNMFLFRQILNSPQYARRM